MEGACPAARAEASLIVGQGLLEEGRFAEARKFLQRCLDNPAGERWQRWESLIGIAHAWIGDGDRQEATRAWERLLEEPGLDEQRRGRAVEALEGLR